MARSFCLLAPFLFLLQNAKAAELTVEIGSKVLHAIRPNFLGVNLDTTWIKGNWCDIQWIRAIRLGRALGVSYLRVGGTMADFTLFKPDPSSEDLESTWVCDMFPPHQNFTINRKTMDRIAWFGRSIGWRLIFDMNLLLRDEEGAWDPSNALEILEYAEKMRYSMDFELGNEPDLYKKPVSGAQIARDYKTFRWILDDVIPFFKSSKIFGPDMGAPRPLLQDFLAAGGWKYIDAVTFHHYYGDGRKATLETCLNADLMDTLVAYIKKPIEWTKNYSKSIVKPEVWLAETATFYHGGAYQLSDRYAAGFMWMDKLGLSALYGLKAVFRQTFFLGNYSLLDGKTNPNPDYWLTVLFKKLQGSSVVNASVVKSSDNRLRFYANCDEKKTVVFGMNLLGESIDIKLSPYQGPVYQYLLEPENNDLLSQGVLLNGRKLEFDTQLPSLEGKLMKQPLTLPAKRFVFYVYKSGCRKMK